VFRGLHWEWGEKNRVGEVGKDGGDVRGNNMDRLRGVGHIWQQQGGRWSVGG
jgi:hypothetical protein